MKDTDIYEEGKLYYDKIKTLKEVNKENWVVFYVDVKTGEKWINEYPESSGHGGGSAILRRIDRFPWE
jgi:hypothetical protein